MEEPPLVVYKDGVLGSEVADISSNGSSRSDGSENARIGTDIPKRNGDFIVTYFPSSILICLSMMDVY